MSNFLPNELVERLRKDPEFDLDAFQQIHEREQRTNSVRFNPRKNIDKSMFDIAATVPWCSDGYFLKERPVYTLDPLFHAGGYYPQEASSMFLSHVIKTLFAKGETVRVLDLCAAPGGKSTLINAELPESSLLVSNEIIKARSNVLEENMIKWGDPNVVVTNNDPSAFGNLPGYFDFMVVDAPCSGSGMIRKDHNVLDEWSESNVQLCAERQRRILADSISSLKTEGYLFYSTCSYSHEENEDIVDWLIDSFGLEPVAIPIDDNWGIVQSASDKAGAPCYRFYPHKVVGEGFFCAVLQKKVAQHTFNRKKLKQEKSNAPQDVAKKWIDSDGLYAFLHHDTLHVFPKAFEADLKAFQNVLYLKNAGTRLGKWTGRELLPAHDMALSPRILDHIPSIEVTLEQSLDFLRKENLDTLWTTGMATGWTLVRYKGINLGWIKVLPNRINNYYPKEYRIANL